MSVHLSPCLVRTCVALQSYPSLYCAVHRKDRGWNAEDDRKKGAPRPVVAATPQPSLVAEVPAEAGLLVPKVPK
jgi:hypothetical protein